MDPAHDPRSLAEAEHECSGGVCKIRPKGDRSVVPAALSQVIAILDTLDEKDRDLVLRTVQTYFAPRHGPARAASPSTNVEADH